MLTGTHSSDPDISTEDYLVIGLATCFIKAEGEIHEVKILEPIPSAALETLLKGIPTSYQQAWGTTLGKVLSGTEPQRLAVFPSAAQFCDDFASRAIATTRTYKARPQAQTLIPLDTDYTQFNFSAERKRLLNSERIVKTEDNIKQHPHTHTVL
jgi:hypothetical protein